MPIEARAICRRREHGEQAEEQPIHAQRKQQVEAARRTRRKAKARPTEGEPSAEQAGCRGGERPAAAEREAEEAAAAPAFQPDLDLDPLPHGLPYP